MKDTPIQPKVFRLGATEWLYLSGLLLLCTGVAFLFGWQWALMICGALLISTAYFNAVQPGD